MHAIYNIPCNECKKGCFFNCTSNSGAPAPGNLFQDDFSSERTMTFLETGNLSGLWILHVLAGKVISLFGILLVIIITTREYMNLMMF